MAIAAHTIMLILASDLPTGGAPPALEFPHFPSRAHAFIWRNHEMVPRSRLAEVLGASEAEVAEVAQAMGLPEPPTITDDQWRRSYLTIIRRNWHLLPYDQLLQLLDWTEAELAFTLREDDFLWAKLGNLKPACERLTLQERTPQVREREAWVKTVVAEEFPDGLAPGREPLFEFVRDLSSVSGTATLARVGERFSPRYCHSYFAPYGDPLIDPSLDPYPEGYLEKLAAVGVSGVWLQAVLYKLAPYPWEPELSEGWETRLTNLADLVARARRHGIGVYLYLNEPRAMPIAFHEEHPGLRGVTEGDWAAMCTSVPEVRAFLTDALEVIFTRVPDLAGVFSISASENLTNCWSHYQGATCERCASRSPAEVLAEVQETFVEGIRRAGASAEVIAWDWGWQEAWVEELIGTLPAEVAVQSVSEWDLPIERGGVAGVCGEYSISCVGPGPRATRHWALAKERGLKTLAKMQAGCTWEIAAVPYIPAMYLVAQHAVNLAHAGVDGVMLGWTLGGYPSPNLAIVAEVNSMVEPDAARAVERVAVREFGTKHASAVLRAWGMFSDAFIEFPFHIGLVYAGPTNYGPMNLLFERPTGYAATMMGFPYDDLNTWRAIYPPDVFIAQFEKIVAGFEPGIETLRAEAEAAEGEDRQRLLGEANVAEAMMLHYRSSADQARFILTRDAEGGPVADAWQEVLDGEIATAKRLYAIQRADSRIGFESSNHYYYVPLDLAEKVLNCRDLRERGTID